MHTDVMFVGQRGLETAVHLDGEQKSHMLSLHGVEHRPHAALIVILILFT